MQSSLTHHTATRKSLDFTVPAAEVNAEFSKVIAKLTPKVKIPGFRPGKAPKSVLLSRFDREIKSEVAEALVEKHFLAAATAAGAQPISRPALDKVELAEGTEGKFNALFDVAPEVKVPEYKGLAVVKKKQTIDDETLAERLEALRQEAAKFIPVEDGAAELGHYVTLDIKVKPQGMKPVDYKDQVIQLAEGRPFDVEIVGMRVDEARKFTLTIPEGEADRAMAGKPIAYEVTMKDLRARVVPELNDDFAKDLGHAAGLEEMRATVRKELEENAEQEAVARANQAVLDGFLDASPFEVPASMVGLQLNDYCQEFAEMVARQGIDPKKVNWEAYRQSRTWEAERAVRAGYLLQAIGNAEDIQVSDEELDAEIKSFMEERKVQQPFETFKKKLEESGAHNEIKGRVRTDKIFTAILASATVTEELLDKAAYAALKEEERKRQAGEPAKRFDAGGVEGGELEAQEEDGGPDAVVPAEAHEHGPECDHDHDHEHEH
jgi:trigger factor